jgi:hypothetical protein
MLDQICLFVKVVEDLLNKDKKESVMRRIGDFKSLSGQLIGASVREKKNRIGIIFNFGDANFSLIARLVKEVSVLKWSAFGRDLSFHSVADVDDANLREGFYLGHWKGKDIVVMLQRNFKTGEFLRIQIGFLFALMGDEQKLIALHEGASIHPNVVRSDVRLVDGLMEHVSTGGHLQVDDPPVWLDQALPAQWAGGDCDRLQSLVVGNQRHNGKRRVNHMCFRGPLWPSEMLWRQFSGQHPVTAIADTIGITSLAKIAELIAIENHYRELVRAITFVPMVHITHHLFEREHRAGCSYRPRLNGNDHGRILGTVRRLVKHDWISKPLSLDG